MAKIINLVPSQQRSLVMRLSVNYTYTKSAALTFVRVRVLLISPHAEPAQPVHTFSRLLSSADTHSASRSECVACGVVIIAAVILCDIPVRAGVGGIGDDVANNGVDLLSTSSCVVGMATSGRVNHGADADLLDRGVSVCSTATVSRIVNILGHSRG